jgi:hypothetical protein
MTPVGVSSLDLPPVINLAGGLFICKMVAAASGQDHYQANDNDGSSGEFN